MKYLLTLLAFWVLSLISFAALANDFNPSRFPVCTDPDVGVYSFYVAPTTYTCYTAADCASSHYEAVVAPSNGVVNNQNQTTETTITVGFKQIVSVSSSDKITYEYDFIRTPSGNNTTGTTTNQVFDNDFTPTKACGDPPPVDETDCSDKSTVDSQPAVFDPPNSFSLSGCFDGCEMKTESNQGGDAVTVRKINSDGTITARAWYSGASCGSTNTVNPSAGSSTVGQVSVSAPNNGKVLVQDLDTQLAFELPDPVDSTKDIEPEVTAATPSDTVLDVVSSVDQDGIESQSVIDNETKDFYNDLLTQLDQYVAVTEDQNGLPVMLSLNANSDPAKLSTDGSGGSGGSGGGTGSGDGDGSSDVDLSGVESRLDQIIEFNKAGEVFYTGSCEANTPPTCDEEKPFCIQLQASYALKCDGFINAQNFIDETVATGFPSGTDEIAEEINLLSIFQDVTSVTYFDVGCPSPDSTSVSVGGRSHQMNFDYTPFCSFSESIRPLILSIGIFMVIRIFTTTT